MNTESISAEPAKSGGVLYKSLGFAYPSSIHARRYWNRMQKPGEGDKRGCWYVCTRDQVTHEENVLIECDTQERAENYLARYKLPLCPFFLRSTLNRGVVTS